MVTNRLERVLLAEVVAALVLWVALGPLVGVARAGHTNANGDCWRGPTPLVCRTNYAGKNVAEKMRVINQVVSQMWTKAKTAYANWNNAAGPASFSDVARSGDSWIYIKTDNSLQAPDGYTENYNSNGTLLAPNGAGNILWSEIYVTEANLFCGTCQGGAMAVVVLAHEMGHAQGLWHHNSADVLMREGADEQGPTPIDIGPNPPCVAIGSGGTRCVFNYSL